MRIRTLACLSLVAGACAVAATGFPRRIGLTASQADVSLPGDLILPGANVVVDPTPPRPSCGMSSATCSSRRTSPRSSTLRTRTTSSCASRRRLPPKEPRPRARASLLCCRSRLRARFCTSVNVTRLRDATARLRGRASPPSRCRRCRCCAICAMRASAGLSMPD